jgi:hypothetical protein
MKKTTMRKKVNNAIKVVTMIVKMASEDHYKKMKQFTITMNWIWYCSKYLINETLFNYELFEY